MEIEFLHDWIKYLCRKIIWAWYTCFSENELAHAQVLQKIVLQTIQIFFQDRRPLDTWLLSHSPD